MKPDLTSLSDTLIAWLLVLVFLELSRQRTDYVGTFGGVGIQGSPQ